MVNLAGLYLESGQFDQALQCIAKFENEGIDDRFTHINHPISNIDHMAVV